MNIFIPIINNNIIDTNTRSEYPFYIQMRLNKKVNESNVSKNFS
jgi:hypothetical protein